MTRPGPRNPEERTRVRAAVGWVALGGALGATARFLVSEWSASKLGQEFPHGTLIVNVTGSFALGLLIGLAVRGVTIPGPVRATVAVGFLGAYTTFSTFAVDTVTLGPGAGRLATAIANVALNNLLSLAAALLGLSLARL